MSGPVEQAVTGFAEERAALEDAIAAALRRREVAARRATELERDARAEMSVMVAEARAAIAAMEQEHRQAVDALRRGAPGEPSGRAGMVGSGHG